MAHLTAKEQQCLLRLARSAIAAKLAVSNTLTRPAPLSAALREKRGCFVTLYQKGALRGCIGTLEPHQTLLEAVTGNACHAAFSDPRFPRLTLDELPQIKIEISVLTTPRELEHRDAEDLKRQIIAGTHGVILSQGSCSATFLPQVWRQLPQKELFLENLCQKGGMPKDAWRDPQIKARIYEVEHFAED